MKKIILITLSLLLISCVPPTREELAGADYGNYPSNYKETIKSYLNRNLKDPDSAKIEYLNEPRTAWSTWGGGKKFGYAVCANVNSKNSFGGYTGYKIGYYLIKNDTIILPMTGEGVYMQSLIEGACKNF